MYMYVLKNGTLEHCCTIAFYILSTKEDVLSMCMYILGMYLYEIRCTEFVHVCTWYVLVHTIMYKYLNAEPCITGFCGALCDASMLECTAAVSRSW